MAKKPIITIGREFGSGGHEIGELLAKLSGIPCYDKQLILSAAEDFGLCRQVFEEYDEKPTSSLLYSIVLGATHATSVYASQTLPISEQVYIAQSNAIRRIAQSESAVIVGRCADYILRDHDNLISIFIHAPFGWRVRQVMARLSLGEEEATKLVKKKDQERANYYRRNTDRRWGDASNYHLSLDASALTMEDAAKLLRLFCDLRHA